MGHKVVAACQGNEITMAIHMDPNNSNTSPEGQDENKLVAHPILPHLHPLTIQVLPSDQLNQNYGNFHVLMGNIAISMAIFTSYFDITRRY